MDSETINIQALFQRAKKGDPEAFALIYKLYFTPIYKYVFFRLRGNKNDAEDVTQDVFLKIYSSLGNYIGTSESNPLPYFYTIARNTLIDRSRKKNVQTVNLGEDDKTLENIPDRADIPSEKLSKEEDAKYLREKIAELPTEQQDVIILRFIDELSTKETAMVLGKTEEAVRQLQSRGLKSLRTIFNGHGEQ